MVKRREDLTSPRANRRIGVQYDSDAFGAFSESIARFLGTARFLVFQTILIVLWILRLLPMPIAITLAAVPKNIFVKQLV